MQPLIPLFGQMEAERKQPPLPYRLAFTAFGLWIPTDVLRKVQQK